MDVLRAIDPDVKCALCSELDVDVLTVGHPDGDGSAHRKAQFGSNVTGGGMAYVAIRRDGPGKYKVQIQCRNCNVSEHRTRKANTPAPTRGAAFRRRERLRLKSIVIAHYSGGANCCSICGYANMPALDLDHVDGGGTKERTTKKKAKSFDFGSTMLYTKLIKDGFPKGYRVLCANDNWREHLKRLRAGKE